jgi:hypothetical protein
MNNMRQVWMSTTAGAFAVAMCASTAAAQTVIVRNAPPSTKVEVQVNTGAVASAAADAGGDARVAVDFAARADEIDVRFFVDACTDAIRVLLMSPGVQPAPAAGGCTRNEVWGVFVMRRVTTFVIDLDGTAASIHVTQGPPPAAWVGRGQSETTRRFFQTTPPLGFVLFGAAGIPTFGQTFDSACGNATTCSHETFTGAGAAGAAYWIKSFIGAQITFAKPAQASAFGGGDTFRFDSTLSSRLVTIAATGGVPLGATRLYGLGGGNYHRATFITTETINDASVVVNNVTQTIKGGTETFEHSTEGWNWMFGGGLEGWITKSIGFYVEAQYDRLKATDVGATEGGIDDHLLLIVAGARVRLF